MAILRMPGQAIPKFTAPRMQASSCSCSRTLSAPGPLAQPPPHLRRQKRERWTKLGYLSLALFCLPTFYFMRVARMFEDAQLTPREVEQGMKRYMEVTELSRGLRTFKELWEGLVDSMLRGWKTLNLVAALLLTAILMLLQMPSVDTNPTWRNTSFLSLAGALQCLLYGSVYVIRFGSLKSMHKGLKWVHSKSKWRSIWVFLALPALYFGISMFWFIVTILGLMSATGPVSSIDQNPQLSNGASYAWRGVIAVHLVPGLLYFILMMIEVWSHDTSNVVSAMNIMERGERGVGGR